MPLTGRPAAVQTPSLIGADEVKGTNVAGVGSGTGVFGTCALEVVVAGEVVALALGGRGELVPDLPEDVA